MTPWLLFLPPFPAFKKEEGHGRLPCPKTEIPLGAGRSEHWLCDADAVCCAKHHSLSAGVGVLCDVPVLPRRAACLAFQTECRHTAEAGSYPQQNWFQALCYPDMIMKGWLWATSKGNWAGGRNKSRLDRGKEGWWSELFRLFRPDSNPCPLLGWPFMGYLDWQEQFHWCKSE